MKSLTRALLIATACLAPACKPELARLDLRVVSDPEVDAYADGTEVVLPAGNGLVVEVRPISDRARDIDPDARIDLLTNEPSVTRVFPVLGEPGHFAITGVRAGVGELDVLLENELEGQIEVRVLEP